MFANNNTTRGVNFLLIRSILFLACLIGMPVYADIITFNQETLITSTDFSYDNNDIVIDGVMVTIDGAHQFESLKIINGGVLTHSVGQKIDITVDSTLEIDSNSRIDVSGKGLIAESATGIYTGGSHGGRGGNYSTGQSGAVYGDYQQPIDLGRGGRNSSTNGTGTIRGGGAIKLVADTLTLEGRILANGENVAVFIHDGGGAGGSIWLDVGTLVSASGHGEIRANGGNAHSGYVGSGGGGGRIAVYYDVLDGIPESHVSASGGVRGTTNGTYGGPGTVYVKNKIETQSYPLHIVGSGYTSDHSGTALNSIDVAGLLIENALVELVGSAHTINADIKVISSHFIVKNNAVFNNILTIENGTVTVQGDATFSQSIPSSDDSSRSFLTIGGQLTVPNNALIVDGITLSLAQDHTFSSIHIKNGGVLTTPVATAEFANGITITADTITVDEGSRIDVSGKGLIAESATGIYSGGSYGGRGGNYVSGSTVYASGAAYGNYQQPTDPGRGGRNSSTNGTGTIRGGGAIKLVADTLALEGRILANGENVALNLNDGAGAGGSIWLDVGTLVSASGHGEIRANGGNARNGYVGGGGGGGRIAVYYDVIDGIPESHFSASGGLRGWTGSTHAAVGTLYFKDKTGAVSYPLAINGQGSGADYAVTPLSGLNNETAILINNARVEFVDTNAVQVPLTAENSEITLQQSTLTAAMKLTNSRLILAGNTTFNNTLTTENTVITVQGNAVINAALNLQNDALTIHGNATFTQPVVGNLGGTSWLIIGGQLSVPDNALIVDGITLSLAQNHTFNSIHIKNGGVLTTPVATAEFANGITITADTITVDEGSRIDVSGKGLLGENGTGVYTGGSHGGRGGNYFTVQSGAVYGNYQQPTDPGRGGRNSSTNGTGTVRGGGAIKLVADSLTLNGSILANGENSPTNLSQGGGAGGSIWLNVGAFSSPLASGEIQASGGRGLGGGGGGRIAIYYEVLDGISQSSVSVFGGARGYASSGYYEGASGTLYFKEKTGAVSHPLTIIGQGSSVDYAVTPLSELANETQLIVNNARVELMDVGALQFPLTAENSEVKLQQTTVTTPITLTNSRLILVGDTTINHSLVTENSVVTIQGNVEINTPWLLQNDAINIQGDAIFTAAITGNYGGTSSLIINGQLTVPGNVLVVDGISLSLAQDHNFDSIHSKTVVC